MAFRARLQSRLLICSRLWMWITSRILLLQYLGSCSRTLTPSQSTLWLHVTIGMDRNPVLLVLSPYCMLVFHNSFLQVTPCLSNVAGVTIHARHFIHNILPL